MYASSVISHFIVLGLEELYQEPGSLVLHVHHAVAPSFLIVTSPSGLTIILSMTAHEEWRYIDIPAPNFVTGGSLRYTSYFSSVRTMSIS